MQRPSFALLLTASVILAACGQTPSPQAETRSEPQVSAQGSVRDQVLEFSRLPGLADDSELRQLLIDNADDPRLLEHLRGEVTMPEDDLSAQLSTKGKYVWNVATGSIANYEQQRFRTTNYRSLNWSDNGCSVPKAVMDRSETARNYAGFFFRSCRVHDFGYGNWREVTGNFVLGQGFRYAVDTAFGYNMGTQCNGLSGWTDRQKCRAAAFAFEAAVKAGGFNKLK